MVVVIAGCRKGDNENRRGDSSVIPPVSDLAPPPKTCGITGVAELSDQGIGEMRIDRTVKEISDQCEILRDTTEQGTEGMQEHVIAVRIDGDIATGLVNGNVVRRIEVTTPHFRTRDSLGVDTPLDKIAKSRGARFFPGEDGVYGFTADHCGLSFRFSVPLRPPKARDWTVAAIDSAHGDATVDRVLITRCQR
jgi:hypothetical protein